MSEGLVLDPPGASATALYSQPGVSFAAEEQLREDPSEKKNVKTAAAAATSPQFVAEPREGERKKKKTPREERKKEITPKKEPTDSEKKIDDDFNSLIKRRSFEVTEDA